ncbi:MAG: OB-fold domain-containing protein [Chloroflexi bacterium]|nr:OB-fold domain-containing protein [Chloroflexota bacterium]
MSPESAQKKQVPTIGGLFTWPSSDPRLIGIRCKSCGTCSFPKTYIKHRPDCKQPELEEVLLSKRGKLSTYTVQHYPPPPTFKYDGDFAPYAIGEVAFPEGVEVFGIITGCKPEELKMGMNMEVIVEKLYTNEKGEESLTWKFRPVSK